MSSPSFAVYTAEAQQLRRNKTLTSLSAPNTQTSPYILKRKHPSLLFPSLPHHLPLLLPPPLNLPAPEYLLLLGLLPLPVLPLLPVSPSHLPLISHLLLPFVPYSLLPLPHRPVLLPHPQPPLPIRLSLPAARRRSRRRPPIRDPRSRAAGLGHEGVFPQRLDGEGPEEREGRAEGVVGAGVRWWGWGTTWGRCWC
ncbi:hypothetical protein GE09DRAFT_1150077, partial [Coniochaeta sp. 2T2.1]